MPALPLPPSGLLDRVGERDALERLVAGVRAGQSRVLVLRGEAGVGKTALLRHLSAAAKGCRIARAAGVESEMELPFAGLHALCAPMLGRLKDLPGPQTAAAEPVGEVPLLWHAAELLGIGPEAAGPAEAAGLVEIGARVRFPHPLVRSAVYRASDPNDRRAVHRALAESTDPILDPDRRAWHRAHAAFLQRAAELTPEPAVRVERSLAAAQAKLDVADTASASDLLAAAELGPLDKLQRARLERLRAQIVFTSRRGRDAPPLLLEAARRLDPLDAQMARETYLEAIAAAVFAGTGPDEREVADAARTSNRAHAAGAADLLLDALVTRFTEGYAASVAPLSRALRRFGEPDGGGEDRRWLSQPGAPARPRVCGRWTTRRPRCLWSACTRNSGPKAVCDLPRRSDGPPSGCGI